MQYENYNSTKCYKICILEDTVQSLMATNNHLSSDNTRNGSGSQERNLAFTIDQNHPFFLNPTNVSGTSFASVQLFVTENYSL